MSEVKSESKVVTNMDGNLRYVDYWRDDGRDIVRLRRIVAWVVLYDDDGDSGITFIKSLPVIAGDTIDNDNDDGDCVIRDISDESWTSEYGASGITKSSMIDYLHERDARRERVRAERIARYEALSEKSAA